MDLLKMSGATSVMVEVAAATTAAAESAQYAAPISEDVGPTSCNGTGGLLRGVRGGEAHPQRARSQLPHGPPG
eukprot:SAG31_NODE_2465_length_5655_cov_2.338553_3_plen_73_part_00